MSGSATSSSAAAAASSRKRAPPPAVAQSATEAVAPQPQPALLSPVAPSPPKKVRKDLLPACAFSGGAQIRAPTRAPAPVSRRWSDLSPAQRCFQDGLALSFSFLSLADLVRAAAVCKAWLAAAKSANIAPVTLDNPPFGIVTDLMRCRLVSSPFCRHVHAITHSANNAALDRFHMPVHKETAYVWTIRGVAELAKLPQLRRISRMQIITSSAERLKSAGGCTAFSFPPRLESADLHFKHEKYSFGNSSSGSSQLRCVLRALRPCRSLTELSVTLRDTSELVLDDLLEVTGPQALTVDIQRKTGDGFRMCVFTKAQIGVIKQLPNLRRLSLRDYNRHSLDEDDPAGTHWLRWLCSLPHRLQQLQEVDLRNRGLYLEHMQLLLQLPGLTALEPSMMNDSALPLLPASAARLQSLKLHIVTAGAELIDEDTEIVRAPLFLPHLTPCSRLTHLSMDQCIFDEDEAAALCQALPLLQTLDLHDVGWPSFEPLRHLPLLKSFSLQQFSKPLKRSLQLLGASDAAPLARLRRLTLDRALERPPTSAASALISALHPPSALLPGLIEFEFWP